MITDIKIPKLIFAPAFYYLGLIIVIMKMIIIIIIITIIIVIIIIIIIIIIIPVVTQFKTYCFELHRIRSSLISGVEGILSQYTG